MTDEELFDKAKHLKGDELTSFLQVHCKDQSQNERVSALLSADKSPDSLLDTTAMQAEDTAAAGASLPKSIGDFEILGELGRGGMGVVYEARQKSLKRKVALKVLSSGLGLSSKAILRFRREAEAAGKLHHTNIVPIYTTGEDKGIHFYAMELIDGPSLDQVIKESCPDLRAGSVPETNDGQATKSTKKDNGASSDIGEVGSSISTSSGTTYFDTVATMIADVAEALDHAHEHGVIHRDVKPSNLLLGPDGRLSINDFGLARMLEQPGMTVSGEFVGSPLYMSPEQITAGRVQLDHRTDIYSLGATLYELLTHQPPFPGLTRDQVLSQILHKEPASTRKVNRKVPIDLDTICMKAIDKDPDRRYQTAGQLADDLHKYVNRHAISARRTNAFTKVHKLVLRNKVTCSAVGLALSILAISISISLYQGRIERLDKLEKTIDRIYETVLTNQGEIVSPLVDQAERLGATTEQMLLLRGLEASSRNYHKAAIDAFEKLPNNLVARSLIAHELFLSGTEVEYMKALRELKDEEPATFEEKLFLGIANVWGDPRRAYEELKELNNMQPGLEYVKTQLARAASYSATLIEQDLDRSEQLLTEANLLSAAFGSEVTDLQEATRLLILLDQAILYEARVESAETEQERVLYDAKLVSKRDEITRYLDASILNLAKSIEYRAFAICHVLRFLGRDEELAALAAHWKNRQVRMRPYTSHLLATHFASRGKFVEARFWFQRVSNAEEFSATQFLLALIDALDSQSERAIADIRAELRRECQRKSDDPKASGLLFFDAIVLYLLGDDAFLQTIEEDRLMTRIQSKGNLDPIINYFKVSERTSADVQRLLRESEQTNSPNLSIMHARFALGIEAFVNDRHEEARSHFEVCASGRQYVWYVNRLSEVMLKNCSSWKWFRMQTANAGD